MIRDLLTGISTTLKSGLETVRAAARGKRSPSRSSLMSFTPTAFGNPGNWRSIGALTRLRCFSKRSGTTT